MKKCELISIISRLKSEKIEEKIVQLLLTQGEKLLLKLSKIESSFKFHFAIDIIICEYLEENAKSESIDILNMAKQEFNAIYAMEVLTDKNAIDAGIAIEGAKIISAAKQEFNAVCGVAVLSNKDVINAGIAIEGAKIISAAKQEFNAVCGVTVLSDKDVINAGIAIESAKIINVANEEFNAVYATEVLRNKDAIDAGIAIEGAKIINAAKQEFNAVYATRVLTDKDAIDAGIAIEGANSMITAKNYKNLYFIGAVLTIISCTLDKNDTDYEYKKALLMQVLMLTSELTLLANCDEYNLANIAKSICKLINSKQPIETIKQKIIKSIKYMELNKNKNIYESFLNHLNDDEPSDLEADVKKLVKTLIE